MKKKVKLTQLKMEKVLKDTQVKKVKPPVTEIYEFVVKSFMGQRQKVGVLYGSIDKDNVVGIGFSKANLADGDKFDKDFGLKIAKERSKAQYIEYPLSFTQDIHRFHDRCRRYFKGAVNLGLEVSYEQ